MVRAYNPKIDKKKKKIEETPLKIGGPEFNKLPPEQQKRIKELASDKPYNELSTTIKRPEKQATQIPEKQAPKLNSWGGIKNVLEGKDVKIFGKKIKTGLGEMVEKGKVITGTAPIGPTAKTAQLIKAGPKLIKTAEDVTKGISSIKKEETIRKISVATGLKFKKIKDMIDTKIANKAIEEILNPKKSNILKGAGKYIGKVMGVDILYSWYVADNVAGGAKFRARDAVENAKWGYMEVDEAKKVVNDAKEKISFVKKFLTISTMLNPLLWPFAKVTKIGVENDEISIEKYEEILNEIPKIKKEKKAQEEEKKAQEEEKKAYYENITKQRKTQEEEKKAYYEELDRRRKEEEKRREAYYEELDRKKTKEMELKDKYYTLLRKRKYNEAKKVLKEIRNL